MSQSGSPLPVRESVDNLSLILERLTTIEKNQEILKGNILKLDQENAARAHELTTMAKYVNMMPSVTEDESYNPQRHSTLKIRHSTNNNRDSSPESDLEEDAEQRGAGMRLNDDLAPAKEMIRIVKTLRGRDDGGVEDFIKSVKKARSQCSQPNRLLDYIMNEKITENAERAIRFIPINNYEDLYVAVRQNVGSVSSVELTRSKLNSTKQHPHESVQVYSNLFRQRLNELRYAVQHEHASATERRLALQIEEKAAVKRYIMGLRDDIGNQVRPLRPLTINDAQRDAMETEIWLQEKAQNQRKASHPQTNHPSNFRQSFSTQNRPFNNQANNHNQSPMQRTPEKNRNFHAGHYKQRPPSRINHTQETEIIANDDRTDEVVESRDQTECQQSPDDCIPFQECYPEQDELDGC